MSEIDKYKRSGGWTGRTSYAGKLHTRCSALHLQACFEDI